MGHENKVRTLKWWGYKTKEVKRWGNSLGGCKSYRGFIGVLLSTRNCLKCFMQIIPFNHTHTHTHTMRWVLILSLFCRWGNWGRLRVRALPKSPSHWWQSQEPNLDNLTPGSKLWRARNAMECSVPFSLRPLLPMLSWGSPPGLTRVPEVSYYRRYPASSSSEADRQLSLGVWREQLPLWLFLIVGACCPVSGQCCIIMAPW